MRITIANQKGGTGKTTTSLYLATAATEAGYTPLVLDTDQDNATAERWAYQAEKNGTPLPFPVKSGNILSLERDYPNNPIFIDTPGDSGKMFNAAIAAADLIIVPSGASKSDVSTTWNVLDEIAHTKQEHAQVVVLVTQHKNGTKAAREIIAAFKEDGQPIVEFTIPLLESINQAYGTVPSPLHGYDTLWNVLANTYIEN